MNIDTFFDRLWADYAAMTPQAARIKQAFEDRGETVINDHVAFRTLALEPIRLARLEPHVIDLGYSEFAPYEFAEKKLSAKGFTHPDPQLPRIFISELRVDELSAPAAAILHRLAEQVEATRVNRTDVLWAGCLWDPITVDEYELLQAESEYAAWFASIGLRPNHFTISINHLQQTNSVEEVLQVVESLGLAVNSSGGRVKGSPEVLLEQGSTLADEMPIEFANGQVREVPTCYYEFAKRYPLPSGELFQGFVAASADKIFESTDSRGGK
jgi:hypothetical protein